MLSNSCTSPSNLDMKESVTIYSPQRIPRQFGLDQGAVSITSDACFSSVWEFESGFINQGMDKILSELLRFIGQVWLEKGDDTRRALY